MNNILRNNLANFITLLNMVCGGASVIASLNGHFSWAIAFIGFAAIFDRYDGKIARKLNTSSELGVQLDSMADGLSFGVAPSILAYLSQFAGENKFFYIFEIIVIIYMCCGLFRLARYNATGLDDEGNFVGVPITASGMFLAMLLLFRKSIDYRVYAVIMVLLSYFMVSKIRLKKR